VREAMEKAQVALTALRLLKTPRAGVLQNLKAGDRAMVIIAGLQRLRSGHQLGTSQKLRDLGVVPSPWTASPWISELSG